MKIIYNPYTTIQRGEQISNLITHYLGHYRDSCYLHKEQQYVTQISHCLAVKNHKSNEYLANRQGQMKDSIEIPY